MIFLIQQISSQIYNVIHQRIIFYSTFHQRSKVSRLPPWGMLLPFFTPVLPRVGGLCRFPWGRWGSPRSTAARPATCAARLPGICGKRLPSLWQRFGGSALRSAGRRTGGLLHRGLLPARRGHGGARLRRHASGTEKAQTVLSSRAHAMLFANDAFIIINKYE